MRSDFALQLINELLWNAILISAPLLGITLLVGLLVSIAQDASFLRSLPTSSRTSLSISRQTTMALTVDSVPAQPQSAREGLQ